MWFVGAGVDVVTSVHERMLPMNLAFWVTEASHSVAVPERPTPAITRGTSGAALASVCKRRDAKDRRVHRVVGQRVHFALVKPIGTFGGS